MYNLENAPVELIRCLELGLPMPGGLLQLFPLVVLEEWRRQWMEGPGRQITENRRGVELECQQAEKKRREQLRQKQMAYRIGPGSIVIINSPRTRIDRRKAYLQKIEEIGGREYGHVLLDMSTSRVPIEQLTAPRINNKT
jgi:hypothetical protein